MVTAFYAALSGILLIVLSWLIIKIRRKTRVPFGDGGNHNLQSRIRAHGNFTEFTPIFLIMLLLAEYNGLPVIALHLLGVLFIAARISHAYSLITREKYENGELVSDVKFRFFGMVTTFTCIGALALILLVQFVMGVV